MKTQQARLLIIVALALLAFYYTQQADHQEPQIEPTHPAAPSVTDEVELAQLIHSVIADAPPKSRQRVLSAIREVVLALQEATQERARGRGLSR